jgi:hypothetical protein
LRDAQGSGQFDDPAHQVQTQNDCNGNHYFLHMHFTSGKFFSSLKHLTLAGMSKCNANFGFAMHQLNIHGS